ncbi:MAG: helicase-related protein [Bryobacteraceae bacterium]
MSDALDLLARALATQSPAVLQNLPRPATPLGADYPVWRLGQAWSGSFGSDEAVLVRQAVRNTGAHVLCPDVPDALMSPLRSAGLRVDAASRLLASPWVPTWLDRSRLDTAAGLDAPAHLRVPNEAVPAESYVAQSFGYSHWKSQALKEACWKVHEAPAGSTVLVALPTGSGKSLCFQFLARFSAGLTLVVVPTVALAIDQYRSAMALPGMRPLEPRYFAADDPDFSPQSVAEAVRTGSTRLVFCSPEACVSGRLRLVLDQLAAEGRLSNIVIDEAHMVGTWGIYFRVDFQLFSALWKQWRIRVTPPFKTVLLSATFTAACRSGLAQLFPSEQWVELISQRLRPEPTYYAKRFASQQERDGAIQECLWRLPRPTILYTTRVDDAQSWRDRFRSQGFRRIECFTGETPPVERRRLLTRWRQDEIDVMVATSAFGLGVDKADIRSVVHACLPEDLDRFYQEVGRTGRDGYSAISVLATTPRDEAVADGMGPTLLRPETIQKRWEALWRTREAIDVRRHVYRVNVRTKRDDLVGTRTYEENVRWNKRLLLQLYRAGRIDLIDLRRETSEDEQIEWAWLELKFPPESPDITALIGAVRDEELRVLDAGLARIKCYAFAGERLCVALARMYGRETLRVCGGCDGCRANNRTADECPALPVPPSPASLPRREVVGGIPALWPSSTPHPLARWMRRAAQVKRVRRFTCREEAVPALLALAREAFGGDPAPYRIDPLGADVPGWEPPFRLEPEEQLVVVHSGPVHRKAWDFAAGRVVTHWLCQGCDPADERGRAWFDQAGIRPYVTPEGWIAAGDGNVY